MQNDQQELEITAANIMKCDDPQADLEPFESNLSAIIQAIFHVLSRPTERFDGLYRCTNFLLN